MYMNRPHRPAASRDPLKFELPSFEEDKRLAFVDSVCATLMTSRFGNGATYTLMPRFEGTKGDDPFYFLDLLERDGVGWHEAATFLGRTILGRACLDALLQRPARSKGIVLAEMNLGRDPTTLSPANLGRGSPKFSGTYLLCVLFAILASFA